MFIENESRGTWTETYLAWKGSLLTEKQVQLLTEGPQSVTDSWSLNAMKHEYDKYFKNNRL